MALTQQLLGHDSMLFVMQKNRSLNETNAAGLATLSTGAFIPDQGVLSRE
jgi:hypothetical protein